MLSKIAFWFNHAKKMTAHAVSFSSAMIEPLSCQRVLMGSVTFAPESGQRVTRISHPMPFECIHTTCNTTPSMLFPCMIPCFGSYMYLN